MTFLVLIVKISPDPPIVLLGEFAASLRELCSRVVCITRLLMMMLIADDQIFGRIWRGTWKIKKLGISNTFLPKSLVK